MMNHRVFDGVPPYYAGPLRATQRDPRDGQPSKHTENRHEIRKKFHKQLRKWWHESPAFSDVGPSYLITNGPPGYQEPLIDYKSLAKRHAQDGFNFVPLVTKELDLYCELEIIFLRPDRPGHVVWAGDIDNRIKTLLDAMRIPEKGEGYGNRTPTEEENPFFCLLEDDKLITKLSVETDRMLEPIENSSDPSDARLLITVRIKPYVLSPYIMHFG
jgi:hypothetical protein